MKVAYIQFELPQKGVDANNESSFNRSVKGIGEYILKKLLPVANPDFEGMIDKVRYWLVECDTDNGIPKREIGLDDQGQVIMKMPFKNNYGYWTDNCLLLSDFYKQFQVSEITKEVFERQWNILI